MNDMTIYFLFVDMKIFLIYIRLYRNNFFKYLKIILCNIDSLQISRTYFIAMNVVCGKMFVTKVSK